MRYQMTCVKILEQMVPEGIRMSLAQEGRSPDIVRFAEFSAVHTIGGKNVISQASGTLFADGIDYEIGKAYWVDVVPVEDAPEAAQ